MRNALIQADVVHPCDVLHPRFTSINRGRIFLTGGTGFFGKWMLHSFIVLRDACGSDLSLTVLSRDPRQFLDNHPEFAGQNGLTFIPGDVRAFDFREFPSFDVVLHGATAASAKLEKENPDEMYSVITEGTRHVLDFVRHCGASRLLFMSSGAVYGPQQPHHSFLSETDAGDPASSYGQGKKVAEQLCLDASAGRFDCVIARPFAFVGPYLPLDTHFAIGNFIRDCLENRPIVIRGDGTPLRSYLYAADLAEWLWTILLKGESGRAYNVGSDQAISILDLAYLVRECAGTNNPIQVLGTPDPKVLPPRYVPSIERARKELGLDVRCPLKDAITQTLDWHRAGGAQATCGRESR
jgi:dTDP-glucose 4,6-dehydratase